MFDGLRVLAVVPARGGSKGVPRKNIRTVGGKPLLVHTCLTAQQVPYIDRIVVSTDDGEIANVANKFDIEVIIRPSELAQDESPTEPVLLHALDYLKAKHHEQFDVILTLEPTSPLRTVETITETIRRLASGSDSVVAVRRSSENIGDVVDGLFVPIRPGAPRRRQERLPFYIESSTIYGALVSFLRESNSLVADSWTAIEVNEDEAVDINTEADFQYLEFLLNSRSGI